MLFPREGEIGREPPLLGVGRSLKESGHQKMGLKSRRKGTGETHVGVVDGDIGMQGLHICVLQPLHLELVLHVGPVYRSPTKLRSRSGQGLGSISQITTPK